MDQVISRCRGQTKGYIDQRPGQFDIQFQVFRNDLGQVGDGGFTAVRGGVWILGHRGLGGQPLNDQAALADVSEIDVGDPAHQLLESHRAIGRLGLAPAQTPVLAAQQRLQQRGDARKVRVDQRLANARLPAQAFHLDRGNPLRGDQLRRVVEDQALADLRRQAGLRLPGFSGCAHAFTRFSLPPRLHTTLCAQKSD